MASKEEKKLLQSLLKLQKEGELRWKKWLLEQQKKNTRNQPLSFSNFSNKNSFYTRSSFSSNESNYGFSGYQNRQVRPPINDAESRVLIKTNYCFAGHSKTKAGKRLLKAEVISKAQANLNYITRNGANQDLDENLSMVYNSEGRMIDNDEYANFRSDLKEMDIAGFRRVVISPDNDLSRDEMKDLVTMSLKDFSRETGKDSDLVFSIHTNTDHTHAHVLIVSEHFNDLKWSQNDLQHFKEIVSENTRSIIDERELVVDKTLHEEISKSREQEQEIKEEKGKKYENGRSF